MHQNSYIGKIKRFITLTIIRLFNCFPIKSNKIFLYSYYGSQYGCNPKYITDYILTHYKKNTFDIVWAFNNLLEKKNIEGIRVVKTMSLKYFFEICTSKIVITNFRTTDLFLKRKEQFYIQTWHSSLRLKQIEKDAENSLPKDYLEMAKLDSKKIDLLISGSQYSTNIFKRSFWYEGEIFEKGTPRNDLFFKQNNESRKKVLKSLGIPIQAKVILYAPTFRKDNRLDVYNLDYTEILNKLECKFGGEWFFFVKLHPHLMTKSSQINKSKNIIDLTNYDDTQELLYISDILISDYSSLIFDFSNTQRPCFLYVPDIEEYINEDRGLYFDIKELPFIYSINNQALIQEIDQFNEKTYQEKLKNFLTDIGSFEQGKACESLSKRIEEICM